MVERRKRKTTSLDQEMKAYVSTHNKKESFKILELQNAWEKVASEVALKHTDNIAFSKRVNKPAILIYVENNHWATQLDMFKGMYQLLLEKELQRKLPELFFLVSQKASYKKEFRKARTEKERFQTPMKSVPLTAEEEADVRETVAQIKDEELKQRLYNAMKTDLEWKKGREGLNLAENAPESPETI